MCKFFTNWKVKLYKKVYSICIPPPIPACSFSLGSSFPFFIPPTAISTCICRFLFSFLSYTKDSRPMLSTYLAFYFHWRTESSSLRSGCKALGCVASSQSAHWVPRGRAMLWSHHVAAANGAAVDHQVQGPLHLRCVGVGIFRVKFQKWDWRVWGNTYLVRDCQILLHVACTVVHSHL